MQVAILVSTLSNLSALASARRDEESQRRPGGPRPEGTSFANSKS